MKKLSLLISIIAIMATLMAFTTEQPHRITIFMIGDSTMANKPTDGGKPERGWGQMLSGFFTDDIIVDNHAVNGRSSKSFIDEGRWQAVVDKIQPGDYVFIQFGHNDEKPKADRHTDPGSTFDDNLRRFVNETRAKGGIPVLFNSIVRRNFGIADSASLKAAVAQDDAFYGKDKPTRADDLSQHGYTLIDTHGAYLDSPRNVARELDVPFVDMNLITKELVESMGPEDSKSLFMWIPAGVVESIPNGREDNTHLNIHGARVITGLTVDAIAEAVPALKPYVRHYDIVVTPDGSGDFLSLDEALQALPDSTVSMLIRRPERRSQPAFESEYRALMDSMNIVGVALAVVKDNKIVYTHEFGEMDIETHRPVQENTLFRIASISKSFTVTTLMQLYEQGKIDITADVSQYLPFTLRNPKYPDVPITIEMMMSHTSSINDSQGYYTNFDPINPEISGENVSKCYNDYAPGTGYEYCNYNTNLLACVIESVTGQRWYEYVQHQILNPLGLGGGYNVDALDRSRFATLYAWEDNEYVPQPEAYQRPAVLDNYRLRIDTPRLSAAGGMKITATDLAKYMLMHMNYGKSPLSKTRIISEPTSRRMQTVISDNAPNGGPDRDHAGLGLMRSDEFTPRVELVGHTGGAYGLRSAMFFDPEEKYGFVMICNGTTSRAIIQRTLTLLYDHFIASAK